MLSNIIAGVIVLWITQPWVWISYLAHAPALRKAQATPHKPEPQTESSWAIVTHDDALIFLSQSVRDDFKVVPNNTLTKGDAAASPSSMTAPGGAVYYCEVCDDASKRRHMHRLSTEAVYHSQLTRSIVKLP